MITRLLSKPKLLSENNDKFIVSYLRHLKKE